MPSKRRTWQILEAARPGDSLSHAFDIFLVVLIVLNVTAVVLGTVDGIEREWRGFLRPFEWFSVGVFTLEYVARVWSAPVDPRYPGAVRGRLRYALTPMALIDLVAVLPFYLPFLGLDLRIARALRLMRIFRIVKLGRHVLALGIIRNVVRSRREELVVTGSLLGLLLLIASSLMYFAEHAAQPEAFASIPQSMWWAVSTVTTVGYGDVYPVTSLGRVLASAAAILGIGLFALPTAILGSGFMEELRQRKQPRVCPHCGKELP